MAILNVSVLESLVFSPIANSAETGKAFINLQNLYQATLPQMTRFRTATYSTVTSYPDLCDNPYPSDTCVYSSVSQMKMPQFLRLGNYACEPQWYHHTLGHMLLTRIFHFFFLLFHKSQSLIIEPRNSRGSSRKTLLVVQGGKFFPIKLKYYVCLKFLIFHKCGVFQKLHRQVI